MSTVKSIDHGFAALSREIGRAHDSFVKVGVQENETRDSGGQGVDMVTVAAWNEFGNAVIPERSFVRSATDESNASLNAMKEKLYGKVLDGKLTTEKGLALLGLFLETQIKKKIQSGVSPENAPSTVARKGSDHTLIDTGQLVQSIRYVVHMGGKKE